jgi:hypothetical protein
MALSAQPPRGRPLLFLWIVAGFWSGPALSSPPAAIDVAVSNSSNARLFWADFNTSPNTALQLNEDANQSSGLNSLEFFFNTCGTPRLDIIAADTNGGNILHYAGGANRWKFSNTLCADGKCPARPDGLSVSNAHQGLSGSSAQLLVAAETGAAGTVPEFWFFRPNCAADADQPFQAGGIRGGQFKVKNFGPVGEIAGTAFVRVAGGGLNVGDLLVSTGSPNLIARVRAADITALLTSGTALPEADVIVAPAFFGSAKPTALTLVPGTAGSGRNESLLVTVPPARVLKLNIGQAITNLQNHLFFTEGLGNGPLGIDSGTRGADTYMVIADRQQGRAVQVRLYVDPTTGAAVFCAGEPCEKEIKEIKANLQFPQGVAFNSDAVIAGNCTAAGGGCQLGSAIELFLPEGAGGEDDLVIAELVFVPDPRGSASSTLNLPASLGANYKLPDSCRGFSVPNSGWTTPVVPVVRLTTDIAPTAGEVVALQEVLSGIFPQLAECKTTGARLFHHRELPWGNDAPEQGTLMDTTVFCSNPSRGMNDGAFSPFAVCKDKHFRPASAGLLSNQERRAVKAEVMSRLGHLETVVKLLPTSSPFAILRGDLLARIEVVKDQLKKQQPTRAEFLAASATFEHGVLDIQGKQGAFDATLPANSYGNLFRRWLALAFYTSETAGQTRYCPAQAIRNEIGIDACF